MATYPQKTEISDTYPNPSNAVARVGFSRLYDWISEHLGMWLPATGTPDAITVTYIPAILTLEDGQVCNIRAGGTNTITDPTFSPNGLPARVITQKGGLPLAIGSISASQELRLRYNLANTRWELMNAYASWSVLKTEALNTVNNWNYEQIFNPSMLGLKGSSTGVTYLNSLNTGPTDYTISVPSATCTLAAIHLPQTYTAPQRGEITVQTSLTINMTSGNKFKVTPSAGGALTFSNLVSGQGGIIIFDNTSNYAITAAATTKVTSSMLATISATGVYTISYESDGVNVYCSCSGAQS
jgi:hypothetical protein